MLVSTNTAKRIEALVSLGKYITENNGDWNNVIDKAVQANPWFTKEHVTIASKNIANNMLQQHQLESWIKSYEPVITPKTIGIVMAGNIPLVGFHDLICGYLSGHNLKLKLSAKDTLLIEYIIRFLVDQQPEFKEQIKVEDRINGCDGYIATGSNNTSRYFEDYFGKYPNIIRKNRTSVAILTGNESEEDLSLLADDIYLYFGLGCRNVTQICVPENYNFEVFLQIMDKYAHYAMFHKYKNNYDYHLALYLLNKIPYMSNSSLLMVENELPFSAVSVLHYKKYSNINILKDELKSNESIQTIVCKDFTPFGSAQQPSLIDYADGIDTMTFLTSI